MRKNLSRVFALILIVVLVNSNFSFAHKIMDCSMTPQKNECICMEICKDNPVLIDEEESACCKITTHELSNSTTFESFKIFQKDQCNAVSTIHFQTAGQSPVTLIMAASLNTDTGPPSDFPVLFSSLRI